MSPSVLSESHSGTREQGELLFARITTEGQVLHANAAMARFLGLDLEQLHEVNFFQITEKQPRDLAEFFGLPPPPDQSLTALLRTSSGQVFRAEKARDGQVLDFLLKNATPPHKAQHRPVSSPENPADPAPSPKGQTAFLASLRECSLFSIRLHDLESANSQVSPLEKRINATILHEISREPFRLQGASTTLLAGNHLEALISGPEHALKAIYCTLAQLKSLRKLRSLFRQHGKFFPMASAVVVAGQTALLNPDSSGNLRTASSGPLINLLRNLIHLTKPNDLLISGKVLEEILAHLPPNWEHHTAAIGKPHRLPSPARQQIEILPLEDDVIRRVELLGPGVKSQPNAAVWRCDWLFCLKLGRTAQPVLRLKEIEAAQPAVTTASPHIPTPQQNNPATPREHGRIGRFRLCELAGTGSMGQVWRAEDASGQPVALKVLSEQESASEENVSRLQREASIMAHLPHKNLCRVIETGEADGRFYIAMEFINGPTLADIMYQGLVDGSVIYKPDQPLTELIQQVLASRRRALNAGSQPLSESACRPPISRILPINQTLDIFLKICRAVEYAHQHSILHRDLKPGNVLLRQNGEPVVVDFGLAQAPTDDPSDPLHGRIVGTLENMAPEQALAIEPDERADVFGLGTILYQMLTGHRWFEATGDPHTDIHRLQSHIPERPRKLNPRLTPELEAICLKALQSDRDKRYPNVTSLIADIERHLRGQKIRAPLPFPANLQSFLKRNSFALSGAFLITLCVAALLWFTQDEKPRPSKESIADSADNQPQSLASSTPPEAAASPNESPAENTLTQNTPPVQPSLSPTEIQTTRPPSSTEQTPYLAEDQNAPEPPPSIPRDTVQPPSQSPTLQELIAEVTTDSSTEISQNSETPSQEAGNQQNPASYEQTPPLEPHTQQPSIASSQTPSPPPLRLHRAPDGKRILEISHPDSLGLIDNALSQYSGTSLPVLRLANLSSIPWDDLVNYPFTHLEILECGPGLLPNSAHPFFANLVWLRIRKTPITDLNFLQNSHRLEYLEILAPAPPNFAPLTSCPLRELVISPEIAAAEEKTRLLRFHPTLRQLRTPGDPRSQTKEDFFINQQNGRYRSTQAGF